LAVTSDAKTGHALAARSGWPRRATEPLFNRAMSIAAQDVVRKYFRKNFIAVAKGKVLFKGI